MKPVKLEFEGINSFSEHTIIDFEKLTNSGIFGIFGDTGSGKSTILDCINFALYGRVERSKEKTDIINYRCNSASVKFTFTMLDGGKRKTYFVERIIKKDKSGTHKAFLYEDDVCIADKATEVEKKVVEILGLEAEDFRKCIALPQGEFSQFVSSAPRERLALIERLFSLSRYGDRLKERISVLQGESESEYQNLLGKFSVYDEVTEENVKLTFDLLEAGKNRLQSLNKSSQEAADTFNQAKSLYEKKVELEDTLKKLCELNGVKEEMEELRRDLSVLPICREIVTIDKTIQDTVSQHSANCSLIQELAAELENTSERLKDIESKLKNGNFAEKLDEYIKLSAKYHTCSGKPEKLVEIGRELDMKREEYRSTETELEKIIAERQSAVWRVKELEKALGGSKTGELEKFVNTEFKGAILRDEYVAMLDYFVNLNAMTEAYDNGSELYKFIQKEIKSQIESFKQRIYEVKDFRLENVNEQFTALQKAIEERDKISEELLSATREVSDADGKIKVNKNRLEALKRDGVELRKRFDELSSELKSVYGEHCRDYAAAERENLQRVERTKNEQQSLNLQLESAKNAQTQIILNTEKVKTLNQTLTERLSELENRRNALVKLSGLKSVKECIELAEKFISFQDADKALKEFDFKFANLTARREELEKISGIEKVSESEVLAARNQKERIEEEFVKINGEIAVNEARYAELTEKLKEKKALLKQLASAKERSELIQRLKEVTKGNRFLEFIANEYLYDISSLASTTLLKLTDGRYFLTYKDNNFQVGDNFDCGNQRGVNTLSGGETFLVSLSLALALSQTICSRSLKSIEFFFLDEGFGTLDSTLVDIVMCALEKLKSAQFTIGVISHVEELKHRIDSKITVIKATESRGSTVQLSC